MKIVLVLPSRRLWRWHAALITELARRGPLEVRLAPSRPYPLATRGWLALERTAFGGRGAIPIRDRALGVTVASLQAAAALEGDVLIDLSGHPNAEHTVARPSDQLSLRFDGQQDEAALFKALQGRRSPRLEVVNAEGRVIAASQAAVEQRDELGRGLGYVHARLIAMVLRALDGPSPASPPPAVAAAVAVAVAVLKGASLPAFVHHALRTKVAAKLSRGRTAHETWRIALRRTAKAEGDGPPSPAGFRVEAGPTDAFHADPFLFDRDGGTFLFVEAYPWATRKGVVACARLDTDGRPGSFETVLEQPFHLSYPQVFAHGGEVLMLPETASVRRLELYRATDFPRGWERVAVMLEGLRIADATLLEHEGRWWLFASVAEHGGSSQDELFAWHGGSPFGPWTAHARNPLVSDVRAGRPAGRFVRREGRLYRPAQDSEAGYGAGLVWCEVLELTPERYREQAVARWRGQDFGAFTGVHTFSEAGGFEAIDLKLRR